jgi:UDP-glucose 4-epimerase
MRIAITGATGNVGTSCLQAFAADPEVTDVVGLARRIPAMGFPKTRFAAADVSTDELEGHLEGVDVLVHLAWDLRPSHDRAALWRNNVDGSTRVFRAAARAGVPALIHASSIGVYSPGPGREVDESWPREGVPGSSYSEQKAAVERQLDEIETVHPSLRVVRMRPALIFKREAASGIQRLFLGSLLPSFVFKPGVLPFVPRELKLQCVHSLDVGEAFRLAALGDVRGAFNLAAEPPLDASDLARVLHSRTAPVRRETLRSVVHAAWRLRLQPSEPGWINLAFEVPVISPQRARRELGWEPRHGAERALRDLLDGLQQGAGLDTPRLHARARGHSRSVAARA